MSIENIFSPDPTFRQGQYHKLSDNVNDWDDQVLSILSSIIPRELGLKSMLHWQKVDDNQGYAIGSVILARGKGQSIGVPVIIKQWHLAPVDTMLIEDKAYPLTSDSLKEVFSGSEIATETIPRHGPSSTSFGIGGMSENVMPPNGGRYVYSSDQGSLLQMALEDAWKDDIDEFRKVASDGEILTAAAERGTIDIFKLAAKAKGKERKSKAKKRNIFQVSKKSHNEYSILGNSEGVFDPIIHNVDRPTMRGFIGSVVGGGEAEREFVSRVDKNREQMLVGPKDKIGEKRDYKVGRPLGQHAEIFLYDTKEGLNAPKPADKFGIYGVKDNRGVTSYGYVFPNVVSLDGKKMDIKLFAGKKLSSVQRQIVGTPEPLLEVKLPETEAEPGKTGTFVYLDEGRALATCPFRVVASIYKGGSKILKIKDFFGNDRKITFSPMAEGMTKITKSKTLGDNVYVIPSKMKFVELSETRQLASSSDDHKKYASGHKDANALRVMRSNDKYVFKASGLGKYANVNGISFDFNNLAHNEAKFMLASFGCPGEKIASILKMHPGTDIEVHGLNFPKVASELPEDTRLLDMVRSLRRDLTKEAAVMEDAEIVDTALSLGFINPDNAMKFVHSIPKLKECVSILSKLLLASRLGMNNIPEEATSSAVSSIMSVIDGLKRLGLIKKQNLA